MRVNNIGVIPSFGMRLTKELERGFEKTKEEIKNFYGEESEEYKSYSGNLCIVKEKLPNYVVDIDYNHNYCFYDGDYGSSCYTLQMRHEDDKRGYYAGVSAENKNGLFTPNSLKCLALKVITQVWADEKAAKDVHKPSKQGVYSKLKSKLQPIKRRIVSIWRIDSFDNLVDKKLAENEAKAKAGIDDDLSFYQSGVYPDGTTCL